MAIVDRSLAAIIRISTLDVSRFSRALLVFVLRNVNHYTTGKAKYFHTNLQNYSKERKHFLT